MSTISDAYDRIVTDMGTAFPNHTRIPNPYKIDENDETILAQGWGVAIGPSEVIEFNSCIWQVRREVLLVLTRRFIGGEFDTTGRADVQKTLLEDHFTLVQTFENDVSLNGTVAGISPTGDAGIQFVFLEKDNFYVIQQAYDLRYKEDLT